MHEVVLWSTFPKNGFLQLLIFPLVALQPRKTSMWYLKNFIIHYGPRTLKDREFQRKSLLAARLYEHDKNLKNFITLKLVSTRHSPPTFFPKY